MSELVTYRLGIFGGMFDPPHNGHIALAHAAREAAQLDRVVIVPAGKPPHRPAPATNGRARLALAVHAFADIEWAVVSDTEVVAAEEGHVGFTYDTVRELVEEPAAIGLSGVRVEPWLVMGEDRADGISSWHRGDELLSIAGVVVVPRPASHHGDATSVVARLKALGAQALLAPMPVIDVASTRIRAACQEGNVEYVRACVPPQIADRVLDIYGKQFSAALHGAHNV